MLCKNMCRRIKKKLTLCATLSLPLSKASYFSASLSRNLEFLYCFTVTPLIFYLYSAHVYVCMESRFTFGAYVKHAHTEVVMGNDQPKKFEQIKGK